MSGGGFARATGAALILVGVLVSRGHLDGWIGERYAFRARLAETPLDAVVHRARAVAANPLLPEHREVLEDELRSAIEAVGAEKVAASAPPEAVPRARFVGVLFEEGRRDLAEDIALGLELGSRRERELVGGEALLLAGRAHAARKRCGQAMPFFDSYVALHPWTHRVDLDRGRCLVALGRVEEAIPLLKRSRQERPRSRWAALALADAYLASGRYQEADAVAVALTDFAPTFAFGWQTRGRALLARGDHRGAARALERALDLRAEDDVFGLVYDLARARLGAGDAAGALAVTEELVRNRPELDAAWELRGRALLAADRPREAIAALERALRVTKRDPAPRWIRFHLADALHRQGRAARAEEIASALVSEDDSFYHGWHLLARVREARGQLDDAAAAYRRALGLRPANRWLEARIDALERRRRASASESDSLL